MLQFKLVLLGDSSVGKSSIVHRFVKDTFDELRESTIGAAFLSQTIQVQDDATGQNVVVKFEIWDTAGQERYKSLAPMYYRNANAALVVYDVTQADSLDKAQSWVDELKNKVGDDQLVIFLAGNKKDLVDDASSCRNISREMAETYSTEQNLLFEEVSAKTGENIKQVFTVIAKRLYAAKKIQMDQKSKNARTNADSSSSGQVNINLPRPSTNDSTSCCS